MPNYRRNRTAGATYFFTVNLRNRASTLLTDRIDLLRAAVHTTKSRHPFHIDAWVILPDHMHWLWTLPEHDADYSSRWQAIKKSFSRALPLTEQRTTVQNARHERGIWQRRFWEHTIRDDADYAHHIDYIHFNPVKHAHAATPADWPHSSFKSFVERGHYPPTWMPNPIPPPSNNEPR